MKLEFFLAQSATSVLNRFCGGLNVKGNLEQVGWSGQMRSKLWRYNQHYFDDLNADNNFVRSIWHKKIISDWIEQCPPGFNNGWDPYPTSLRIVNWIKWDLGIGSLSHLACTSLGIQSRWLAARLEWHILGNHLFSNAKALVFAGLFFEGEEAEKWLTKGMEILSREVNEQILDDGGHFELSPMYHALSIEDFLDLINICNEYSHKLTNIQKQQVDQWKFIIPRMLSWLFAVTHPDNKISFFNDAAFNIAPENDELQSYASRLGIVFSKIDRDICDLPSSGLVKLKNAAACVIADLANIGPNYLPGHAHADTLSFEMSHGFCRVFVNSGISKYGLDTERLRQRGTRAHNTVCVAKKNSSEVWAGFRVGRRARITNRHITKNGKFLKLSATHDGYCKSFNGLMHQRDITLSPWSLIVIDKITVSVDAEARFHLHPSAVVETLTDKTGIISISSGHRMYWASYGSSSVVIEDTTWHPEFGISIPNKCIVCNFNSKRHILKVSWNK